MTIREMLKLLKEDGWYLARQKGSHRQLNHPTKHGTVTVAGKLSKTLGPGIKSSILKQAGLKE